MNSKVIVLIIAMSGLVQCSKDAVCSLEPFVPGPCVELTILYSYINDRNDCIFWQGCPLDGNNFISKDECEARCKD
ncbi:kunitz-type serine protease inhibitor As-fr-19 [Drosophila ficusphila]|uniref:kunitz-type serine protease inhibitor As-fr-19 n=1 Tax=Drosophila ficusphila TaxID=30025 RepID=UPI0007E83842|nr:kunitz-type serine protease inhibitor As-fr-19 [Drosophila ficusphila]